MNTKTTPKVGVGVMIFKDGKVLFNKRKGPHGAGEWSFPGGHLEYLETFEDCARRETAEEAGITIKNVRFLYLANITKYAPKHYLHIGMIADWDAGEPKVMEPDKVEGEWQWFSPDALPEGEMFEFCKMSFDAWQEGKVYFERY